MRRTTTLPLGLALIALLAAAACNDKTEPVPTTADVQARLQEPTGGYEMTDEAPAFEAEDLFASAGLLEAQAEVLDELEDVPEVVALSGATPGTNGARRFVLVAVWGQPRLDWSVPTWTDWSGEIAVSNGAVLARRTVRFDAEDALLPRTDPRVLPFESYTQPHHDGLVVNLFEDPNAPSTDPGQVTIQLANLAQPVVIPYDQLDGFRQLVTVDNLGNKLLIAAEEIPANACAAGFLLGHWHRLAPGVGFFFGQWAGAGGALHGHLIGIYGVTESNEQRLFGKYVGLGGQARGVLVGGYDDGHFFGQWHGANGPEGVIGGVYHDTLAGPESGGVFLGGWARTNCP